MRARILAVFAVAAAAAVVLSGCTGAAPGRSTWAFTMVEVTSLNLAGTTGLGVTVAIIDTGIDLTHPSLSGVVLAYWEDLVSGVDTPYDDNGHGTAMASILVGRGSLAGGAPSVSLIMIKAIAADGTGSDRVIASAIRDAASHGADIISLSLGGAGAKILHVLGSDSVNAVESAAALGILVVGSAGNDGEADDGQVASPGVAVNAISVGAVDSGEHLAPFSSVGKSTFATGDPDRKPEVVAPGVDIAVAWVSGRTELVSGTSPAAVFVSAGLALVLELKPAYKRAGAAGVDAVKNAIMETARKAAGQTTPHDDHYGYGIFQAGATAHALV